MRWLLPLILTLTWDPVPGSAGYLVCYKESKDSWPICSNAGPATEYGLIIPVGHSIYSVLVKAYEPDGTEGEASELVLVPAPPSNLHILP